MENDPSPAPPAFRCLLGINGGTGLCFQRVPESKTIKNRMHLDVIVDDLASATRWVEENGGQRRSAAPDFHEGEWRWRIMADPEGNEFCFVPVSN
jgi:predicted enzyme related to lactoylglutathione lyase